VSLKQYQRKRDFRRTPEPRGRRRARRAGDLYVIQKHAARNLHYDFRLELDGTLKSWAVPKGPSYDPAEKRLAVQVEDHPLEYGEFEGIIPKGAYGGGTVMLWDVGRWEPIGDAREGYRKGKLRFRLDGEKLRGGWTLVRMRGKSGEGDKNWLLIKEKDEQVRAGGRPDILDERSESVASGRAMEEIAADQDKQWKDGRAIEKKKPGSVPKTGIKSGKTKTGKSERSARVDPGALPEARKAEQPGEFKPQLATLVSDVPRGDDWLHEIKFDGYRVLCFLTAGKARLVSRNGNELTRKLRSIADAAKAIPVSEAILDGEVVALKSDGASDFQTLQNALKEGAKATLAYYLFDLPYCEGHDLTRTPLVERKRLLRQLLNSDADRDALLRFSDHFEGQGASMYQHACSYALEGIISKQAGSPYVSRRTRAWVKVKCVKAQEFVICGYTEPAGSRAGFGALLLGYHDPDGELVYCGRVGTGFNARSLERIHKRLVSRGQQRRPFRRLPKGFDARGVHWVRPELVAQVKFANWTDEGLLRQASFQGLREDKRPREVVREAPEPVAGRARSVPNVKRSVEAPRAAAKTSARTGKPQTSIAGQHLTNPERILYPEQGITKRDLALFYEGIASWILPHLTGRPLSLVRCPQGQSKSCFFQKHIAESLPDSLDAVAIEEKEKRETYIAIHDLSGLIALVQLGVLEIHPWGSRSDNAERPDRLVFDLDPGPGVAWKTVVRGAYAVRDRLSDLGLNSFVKTTGGKGLHVVAPLGRRAGWDELKSFAKAVAVDISRADPKRYIATMSKAKRVGKIFVDYLRNGRGATSVAAYSTRAREGAPVSTPVSWQELDTIKRADAYNITNLGVRLRALKRDPWEGFFDVRQFITAKMRQRVSAG
jgi:bifunctional non-homologous end joining protein LigD